MQQDRVLITAGGSGIGREMAISFAAAGSQVFVVDLDARSLFNKQLSDGEITAVLERLQAVGEVTIVKGRVTFPKLDWAAFT